MEALKSSRLIVVRKGRKPGIYTSWEEAKAQIKGFEYPEFRPFYPTEIEKITDYLSGKILVDDEFFAVRRGRKIGVFKSWDVYQQQVIGFDNAEFKSFNEKEEALKYLGIKNDKDLSALEMAQTKIFSEMEDALTTYVDGSFSSATLEYSSAFIVIKNNEIVYEQGRKGKNSKAAEELKAVAGELSGAMMAAQYAVLKGCKKIIIHHDNESIARLITGADKPKNDLSREYVRFMDEKKNVEQLSIEFIKVKAHKGNKWNNYVDKLAKNELKTNGHSTQKTAVVESLKEIDFENIEHRLNEINFISDILHIKLRKRYEGACTKARQHIAKNTKPTVGVIQKVCACHDRMIRILEREMGISSKHEFEKVDVHSMYHEMVQYLMKNKQEFIDTEINFIKNLFQKKIKTNQPVSDNEKIFMFRLANQKRIKIKINHT